MFCESSQYDSQMTEFTLTGLFDDLAAGRMLVTGNTRLARVLSGQYDRWRTERGDAQWLRAPILPWNAWLERLWQGAALDGVNGTDRAVPGAQQLQALWSSVLERSELAGGLLRPQALAAQVMESRRLAVEWMVDFHHPAWRGGPGGNENHAAFARWNRDFEALCRERGWLAPEDRAVVLARAIEAGACRGGDTLDLLGFDEFTPLQRRLIEALRARGADVRTVRPQAARGAAMLWRAASRRAELDRMARWVRQRMERDPRSTVAVVAPDQDEARAAIERQLQRILEPAATLPHGAARPWNASMGMALDRAPVVAAAFDLLALVRERVDIQAVGRVLRSPWIRGGAEERGPRGRLERQLRETYPRQLALEELAFQAGAVRRLARDGSELPAEEQLPRPWNAPLFRELVTRLQRFERETRGPRRPSAWADAFENLLKRVGWPRSPDASREGATADEHDAAWQAQQAWQEALRELAALDATGGAISRDAAVARLRQVCRERIFQPRGAPARVQVLGLYEAIGLRFDHLWVTGLHGANWPAPARPDPFIPRSLQEAAGMPRSSPRRELEVARTITERLLESAPEIVFSFPAQAGGEPLAPSPLLAALPAPGEDGPDGWAGDDWAGTMTRGPGAVLDALRGPGPLRGSTARGGSSILKHQALCPFRAFAANRLGAEGLDAPVDGISPMLHGSLLHRALEGFWRETRSRAALLTLDHAARGRRIRAHVAQAIDEERGLGFRPHFRDLEARRLERLVDSALELERERPDFEVIDFEREVLYEIEGQVVRLYIDRVDRLAGGGLAIIDYKSGRVDPSRWFGPRPEDPQLPLYAVSAGETPFAVVFEVIRDDECLFKGVVRDEGAFPGLPPKRGKATEVLIEAGAAMPETVDGWREVLHGLMADFLQGRAAVDPKDGRKTCDNSWCELQPLCRLGELERLAADGRGDAEATA